MKNILKFIVTVGVMVSLFSCGTDHITVSEDNESKGGVIYVSPADDTAAVQMADVITTTTASAV